MLVESWLFLTKHLESKTESRPSKDASKLKTRPKPWKRVRGFESRLISSTAAALNLRSLHLKQPNAFLNHQWVKLVTVTQLTSIQKCSHLFSFFSLLRNLEPSLTCTETCSCCQLTQCSLPLPPLPPQIALCLRCRHGELHHTLAVPPAAAARPKSQTSHLLDVRRRRVQAAQVRGGGQALGAAQEQDQHELRQAEQSPALLLWQSTTHWGPTVLGKILRKWQVTLFKTLIVLLLVQILQCSKLHFDYALLVVLKSTNSHNKVQLQKLVLLWDHSWQSKSQHHNLLPFKEEKQIIFCLCSRPINQPFNIYFSTQGTSLKMFYWFLNQTDRRTDRTPVKPLH